MAMANSFIIINFCVLLLSCKNNPQTTHDQLTILSLDKSECNLTIRNDYINNRITFIANEKDSVCFEEFNDMINTPQVQGNNFCCFTFSVRGGSGIKLSRYVELYVAGGIIQTALDIYSNEKTDSVNYGNPVFDSIYNFKIIKHLTIKHERVGSDSLLKIIEEIVRNQPGSKDSILINSAYLKFDPKLKIFSNTTISLNGTFKIIDRKSRIRELFINDEVPVIKLPSYSYYYINRKWYIQIDRNIFNEYSNSCNKT